MIGDIRGQISAEYVMIIGIGILVSLSIAYCAVEAIELNTCMAAARNGAFEGCMMDGLAVYPSEKFELYTNNHSRLKTCSKVVIIGLKWIDQGYDPLYQKTKIKIKIFASTSTQMTKNDRTCAGDRINYYARKNICKAFKTENLSNIYYNPAFSDRYFFTTFEVEWV